MGEWVCRKADLSVDWSLSERYLKRLVGRKDIEDALKRLEKLSHDEGLTATVQVLEATERVVDGAQGGFWLVSTDLTAHTLSDATDRERSRWSETFVISSSDYRWVGSQNTTGDQLRDKFHDWLSPPDPSINYNTARDAFHDGTAEWFTQSYTFEHWKVSGSESLLWVHGKRKFLVLVTLLLLMTLPWLDSRLREKYP
jgi:hypothetical protein